MRNGYFKNVHARAVRKLLAGEWTYIAAGFGWFDVGPTENSILYYYSILLVLILNSSCCSNSPSDSFQLFVLFICSHLPYGTSTSTPSTAFPVQNHGSSFQSSDTSPASAASSTATCAASTKNTEPQSVSAGLKYPSSRPMRGRVYTDTAMHSYRKC